MPLLIACEEPSGALQPCRKCGGLSFIVELARGPHGPGLRCNECKGDFRWMPKARAVEFGFIPAAEQGDLSSGSAAALVNGEVEMALGLSLGGGEFKPFVKYDSKSGRWTRMDRVQDSSGNFSNNPVDITNSCCFVPDLENVNIGWIRFAAGAAPVKHVTKLGSGLPPKPPATEGDFKQGFLVDVLLNQACGGGGPREVSSVAQVMIGALDKLHDSYRSAPESKAGKLPIVDASQTVAVRSKQGTNYAPVFNIIGWIDRPPAFDGSVAPADPTPAAQAAPVAPPAPVAAAVMAPQPAPAQSLAFG